MSDLPNEKDEKTYKGSIQSDLVNISVIWLRIVDNSIPGENWNTTRHYHAFYELHVVLEGFADMDVQDHDVHLEKGQYLLLLPKNSHCFRKISPDYKEYVAGFYLDFSDATFDSRYIRNAMRSIVSWEPLSYDSCFLRYIDECFKQINSRPYLPTGVALCICLLLMETARQVMPLAEGSLIDDESLVSEVKYYIASNLSSGITTESVAAYMHINARNLNRILEKRLQKSVNELIMEEKMNCIRRLLRTTDMTLDHIAQLSGFTNAYNMSRSFKKQEGMAPGEYRKTMQKNQ